MQIRDSSDMFETFSTLEDQKPLRGIFVFALLQLDEKMDSSLFVC